jgi:hypothetical protein
MNVQHAADILDIELGTAGIPANYRCDMINAFLAWFRYLRSRGNVIQRFVFAFAVEALKLVQAKYCKEPSP